MIAGGSTCGHGSRAFGPQRPCVCQELLGDQALVIVPRGFDFGAAASRHQRFIALEKLLHLDRIISKRFGRRVDGGQSAADNDDRQANLHVGDRVCLRGAGQLQRHQEVRRGAHTLGQALWQLEHRRSSCARGQRDMIETQAKGIVCVERSAETDAAIECDSQHGARAAAG